MTSTLEIVDLEHEVIAYDDNGDQIFTHYAPSAKVTEGYVMGTPVVAICGKVFVPHRDPNKYPICKPCSDIASGLFLNTGE